MMFNVRRIALILLIALTWAPIARADRPTSSTAPTQQIVLLHLPGIGGLMRIDALLTGGLKKGGLQAADVVVYDWTNGNAGLAALGALERNREEAKKIAEEAKAKRAAATPAGN